METIREFCLRTGYGTSHARHVAARLGLGAVRVTVRFLEPPDAEQLAAALAELEARGPGRPRNAETAGKTPKNNDLRRRQQNNSANVGKNKDLGRRLKAKVAK